MSIAPQKQKYLFVIAAIVLLIVPVFFFRNGEPIDRVYRYCESGIGILRSHEILIDLNRKRVINGDVVEDIVAIDDKLYRSMLSPFLLSYPHHFNADFRKTWLVAGAIFKIETIKDHRTKIKIVGKRIGSDGIQKTESIVSDTGEFDSISNSYNDKSPLIIKPCESRGFKLNEIDYRNIRATVQ